MKPKHMTKALRNLENRIHAIFERARDTHQNAQQVINDAETAIASYDETNKRSWEAIQKSRDFLQTNER